jgi:hypothetical protein
MKGGNFEPNKEFRQAELDMDRHTNSRLNCRYIEQAYVGYRLGPNGHGERLEDSRFDPDCIPKVARQIVRS